MKCDRCESEMTGAYWTEVPDEEWCQLCNPCHDVWVYNQKRSSQPTENVGEQHTMATPWIAGGAVEMAPSGVPSPRGRWIERAKVIGELVANKQKQYGRSVNKTGNVLRILYPDGVATHQYDDVLLTVRILDKLSRIAQRGVDGQDLGGESPYQDLCRYALLGLEKDET